MLVAVLGAATANAQFSLGLNGGVLIPTEDGIGTGFGGAISGEYLLNPNIGVGLSFGYYSLEKFKMEESGISIEFTPTVMPITLTGRYYFLTEELRPYGGVDVGFYSLGLRSKVMGISVSDSESHFGCAPVVGLQYGLTNALALDVNAKYHLVFADETNGFIGFNLGLVYTFGK